MKKMIGLFMSLFLLFGVTCMCVSAESATPGNGNHYYIRNCGTGKYLTVINYSLDGTRANLVQQSLNYYSIQAFKLLRETTVNGVNHFEIVSDASAKELRLDVAGASDTNGTNIGLFTRNSDFIHAQRFRFISNGNGTYRIMPQLSSDKCIEVDNGSNSENVNIQLNRYNGATYQQWELVNAAYFLNEWDLVDSGKHLDWGNESSFLNEIELAEDVWNVYKSNVIRKDSLLRIEDVTIKDDSDIVYAGLANDEGEILLNKAYLQNCDEDAVVNVIAHELGHCLGLGHIIKTSEVMYHTQTTRTLLGATDERSYDKAYTLY